MGQRALNVGILAPGVRPGTGAFTYLSAMRAAMAERHRLCNMDGTCPDLDLIHVIDIKRLDPHFLDTLRVPLVEDVHDDYWVRPDPYPAPDALLRRLLRGRLYSHHVTLLRRASAVVAHSQAVAASLLQVVEQEIKEDGAGGPEVHVVPLGNSTRLNPVPAHSDDDVILLLGRDIYRKGFSVLVQALPLILKERPHARLVVIGREYAHTRLIAGISSRGLPVTFLPHQDGEALEQWWGKTRVLALPSWQEAFGLVLLEAMARGVPVVASRVGGIPEAVEDGVSGLLVERGSAPKLVEKIVALLGDEELRARLIAGGIERARRFSLENMADALDRVYHAVAGTG